MRFTFLFLLSCVVVFMADSTAGRAELRGQEWPFYGEDQAVQSIRRWIRSSALMSEPTSGIEPLSLFQGLPVCHRRRGAHEPSYHRPPLWGFPKFDRRRRQASQSLIAVVVIRKRILRNGVPLSRTVQGNPAYLRSPENRNARG